MNIEKMEKNIEPEKVPEKASDMEIALFLAKHIDRPCEAEVKPGEIRNIREFYIKEAKRLLEKMENPEAKKFLELKIQEYKN
jgi:hypothetical protein